MHSILFRKVLRRMNDTHHNGIISRQARDEQGGARGGRGGGNIDDTVKSYRESGEGSVVGVGRWC